MKRSKGSPSTLQRATQAQRAGRPAEAKKLYEKLLAREPNHRGALDGLSVLEFTAGRYEEAATLLVRLVERFPDEPAYHLNLGEVNRRLGRYPRALEGFRRALELKPDFPEALFNSAVLLEQAGELDLAIRSFEGVIDQRPEVWEFHQALARALGRRGDEMARSFYDSCATLLQTMGSSSPFEALVELSGKLRDVGRQHGAIEAARRAVEARPSSALAQRALAAALADAWQLEEALSASRRAIALDSTSADAHFQLGRAQMGTGDLETALASFRTAIELDPHHRFAHSSLVFALAYVPGHTQRAIADEARSWATRHTETFRQVATPQERDRSPDRRLRLGYVSGDFCSHPMANFFIPILEHHDRSAFEVYCYGSVRRPDAITERIRDRSDVFRNVSGISDAALAEIIRGDRIDLLVDLSLHSGDHRLRTFAAKPAPVQLSYLGYLGTTGLEQVDYRVTAPYLDDPVTGGTDIYPEAPLGLPQTYWCYDPLDDETEAATSRTAALAAGYVTFGSQNSFHKISDLTLALWARVLRALPRSKLVMPAPAAGRTRVLSTFASEGITDERVTFLSRQDRREYLNAYRTIDLCLDTTPFNGATTTLDAFWMGTPTLTLVGSTPVGRAGLSLCMNLGLPELVARSPDEFEAKALELTSDLGRISELHAALRSRLKASPLMDATRFVADLERLYRKAWAASG